MMLPVVKENLHILYKEWKGPGITGYAAQDTRDIAWLRKYNPAETVRPVVFYNRSKRGRGAMGP